MVSYTERKRQIEEQDRQEERGEDGAGLSSSRSFNVPGPTLRQRIQDRYNIGNMTARKKREVWGKIEQAIPKGFLDAPVKQVPTESLEQIFRSVDEILGRPPTLIPRPGKPTSSLGQGPFGP